MAFENLTPEAAAMVLADRIATDETKRGVRGDMHGEPRKYLLDLYAECLMTVRQPADRLPEYG